MLTSYCYFVQHYKQILLRLPTSAVALSTKGANFWYALLTVRLIKDTKTGAYAPVFYELVHELSEYNAVAQHKLASI